MNIFIKYIHKQVIQIYSQRCVGCEWKPFQIFEICFALQVKHALKHYFAGRSTAIGLTHIHCNFKSTHRGKCKITLSTARKRIGGLEVLLHSFLIPAVEGGEGSVLCTLRILTNTKLGRHHSRSERFQRKENPYSQP